MRNARGLSGKQSKFINTLIEGHWTSYEVGSKLKIRSSTMQRWMNEEAFITQWKKANDLLEIKRKTDEETVRIRIARSQLKEAGVQNETELGAMTPPAESDQEEVQKSEREETTLPPRMTERERILQRHGEEAAKAFDRLIALRQKLKAEKANAANSNEAVHSLKTGENHGGQSHSDVSTWPADSATGDGAGLPAVRAVSLSGEGAGDLGGGLGGSV